MAKPSEDVGSAPPETTIEGAGSAQKLREGESENSKIDATKNEKDCSEQTPQPSQASPFVEGARVKVHGLVKAAQFNGQFGKVLRVDQESERIELRLESGKELKVKKENAEVVKSKGGFKGGFIKNASKLWDDEPEKPKPKHKFDHLSPMEQLQAVGATKTQDVPEWMKPGRDLMDKVDGDAELANGAKNRKILEAVEEVTKNPEAWDKYKDDPEIVNYFNKMMGLFGDQFQAEEKKKAPEEKTGAEFKVDVSKLEEESVEVKKEKTVAEALKESPGFAKKGFLKDKFSKPKPPPEPTISRTLGGTDYSKFDFIESDSEDEEEFTGKLGKGVRGLLADGGKGELSKKDPKIANALGDAKVQRVLRELKTCDDPERIAKLINEGDVREKMQVLLKTGALDLEAPSYGNKHPTPPAPPTMQEPKTKLGRWMKRHYDAKVAEAELKGLPPLPNPAEFYGMAPPQMPGMPPGMMPPGMMPPGGAPPGMMPPGMMPA